jgi:hypothetical protein
MVLGGSGYLPSRKPSVRSNRGNGFHGTALKEVRQSILHRTHKWNPWSGWISAYTVLGGLGRCLRPLPQMLL